MKKQACIIFSKKCDGNIVLGKVRDRMYDPEVCVYHVEVDGTEVCVMFDRITGFCEGINEHGIGVVNSALMVLQDEAEGTGNEEPELSPDGIKILKALAHDSVPKVLESLISYKPKRWQQGLKGHTLVSDGQKVYALENTRIHTPKTLKLNPDKVNTRTNHGIYYPGAGYTKGPDYISSIVRQWEAKKQLEKATRAEDLMPSLTQAIEKTDGSMNPVRFTDKMRTTSQMVADPVKGEVLLYLVPGHSKFEGVRNLLPGKRKPKIKVRVFKYPSKDALQDPYVTVPDEMDTQSSEKARRRQVMADRVAARYKSKKKVKTKDGDEATVYEYSDRQVADRNRKKAERIEHLRKSMKKLRTKVRKDVESKDFKKRDLALAVGLMDETYERVGNPQSAKDGHYGVTTWTKGHIRFSGNSVTITYVGKSGVKHKKKVTNARLLKGLRAACKDKKKDDCVLDVSASDVNAYLKPFGISAKDIRGFHANDQMKAELKKTRKGKLPEDPKERKKKLKEEFAAALEVAAEKVGHKASTLKSQYLVPGLEDDYMKDGTINESHVKKGTKSDAEREDEAVEKMLRKEPKKKPPRYDLRNNRTLDEEDDENLGSGDKGDRDLSMKWNKVARRVAFRWNALPTSVSQARVAMRYLADVNPQQPPAAAQQAPSFDEWVKEKKWPSKAEGAEPGAEIGFEGLKKQDPEEAKKVREEYRRQFPGQGDDDKGDQGKKQEPEQKQRSREDIDAELEEAREDVEELEDALEGLKATISEQKDLLRKLRKQKKAPKVDPEERKAKIESRIDVEKKKMRESARGMVPLGKEIDALEDKLEEFNNETKGQKKVISDAKKILKQIGEDHPQAERINETIASARQKIRDVKGKMKDAKADLKAKEADYEQMRQDGKQSAKTIKFLEKKLKEPAPEEEGGLEDQISDARKKLRDAEDDFEEKREDLGYKKERVDALKKERRDPTGTQRMQEQQRKKERREKVQKALDTATKSMEDLVGPGSGLPRDTRKKIEDQLEGFNDEQVEQFAVEFSESLKNLTEGDPTSESSARMAAGLARMGFTTDGLKSPDAVAERAAQIVYAKNVVANPMIAGGTPVGVTEMTPEKYSERAIDGYEQFKGLNSILRRDAADRIAQELRGLDPETDRAQELNGILAGINMAQIVDTGDALRGQPQPNKGATALIRRMAESGNASLMLQPSEDLFSEEGRKAIRSALNNMDDNEVAEFILSQEDDHPFTDMAKVLTDPSSGGSEYKELVRKFMVDDFMVDIWGSRAVRDMMEAAGAEDWDDPEAWSEIQTAVKGQVRGREEAFAAMDRIQQAKQQGQRPDPEDEALVRNVLGEGGGLREQAKGLLDTLKEKFNKFVITPATAVLKNFVETGDKTLFETETLPHPDENSPQPRTKEQREKARSTDMSGYRDGYLEFKPTPEWRREHEVRTSGGSYVLGTPHLGDSAEGDKWIQQELVSSAVNAAKEALANGKKVVFLGEGGDPDDMEGSEQKTVADALRQVGDVETGTWDDEATYIDDDGPDGKLRIDPEAAATKALLKKHPEPGVVEAALAAAMWDQMDEDENPYTLSDDARKALQDRGIDPDNREELSKIWENDDLSGVAADYARIRDENIARKIREIENDGGVAIVTPGAQHAYQLKPVLEGNNEGAQDEEHGPRDVWRTEQGNWRAKNEDGVPKSFKDKAKADLYAGRRSRSELEQEGFSADFDIPVEERGPNRFASTKLADQWVRHVCAFHPDDPNRPRIVIEAA